jgi:hypothetical protein
MLRIRQLGRCLATVHVVDVRTRAWRCPCKKSRGSLDTSVEGSEWFLMQSQILTRQSSLLTALSIFAFSSNARAEVEVHIDFESVQQGTSVEGLGTVHELLDIDAVHELLDIDAGGNGMVVGEGLFPSAYGGGLNNWLNGCLGNPGGYTYGEVSHYGQGFADVDKWHDYLFSFAAGTTVSQFSITMLDFGDYNPTSSDYHEVRLAAYDADGYLVDEDVLAYDSVPKINPPEHRYTGDACYAMPGDLGNYTFEVAGAGITWVVLEITAGIDPHIAFDDISFTACEDVDQDGVCDDCDVCPDTVIPELPPSDGLETNHYALIDVDTVFDTRLQGGTVSASAYTLEDTHGCSCEQIIDLCGVGQGHAKHGCSQGVMENAIAGQCFDLLCEVP